MNNQEPAVDNCIYCLKKFRLNLSPIICSMCEKGSHASCSGLQRGKSQNLRKMENGSVNLALEMFQSQAQLKRRTCQKGNACSVKGP